MLAQGREALGGVCIGPSRRCSISSLKSTTRSSSSNSPFKAKLYRCMSGKNLTPVLNADGCNMAFCACVVSPATSSDSSPFSESNVASAPAVAHDAWPRAPSYGLLVQDAENAYLNLELTDDEDAMTHLLGSAITYRIAKTAGFSLHAGVSCEAHQRDKRERLCRYIDRSVRKAKPGCRRRRPMGRSKRSKWIIAGSRRPTLASSFGGNS